MLGLKGQSSSLGSTPPGAHTSPAGQKELGLSLQCCCETPWLKSSAGETLTLSEGKGSKLQNNYIFVRAILLLAGVL